MDDDDNTEWQPVSTASDKEGQLFLEVVVRGGREKVGLLGSISFDTVAELLTDIAQKIGATLEKARPSKASVELGVEFGLQEGKLVALIARGSGKANLKLSLTWDQPR
jgi:hypothetical protein